MDGIFTVIILVLIILVPAFIFVVIAGMREGFEADKLRSIEESNVSEIVNLKRELSELRERLQEMRLSRNTSGQYSAGTNIGSADDSLYCFYCDERILRHALVCAHCRRPNHHNIEGISKNDAIVKRMISNV